MFEDTKEPVAKFGMLKGAMRTITGKIGKIAPQKFSVQTKTATIGIRGTNFSLVIGEDGSYNAYCTYGAIGVTIKGEEFIVKQGYFLSISPTGKIIVKEFTPKDLKNMKKENFGTQHKRKGKVTKGEDFLETSEKSVNNEQIDMTTTDYSDVVITDATDKTVAIIQDENDPDENTPDENIPKDEIILPNINWSGPTFDNNDDMNPNVDADIDLYFNPDSTALLANGYSYIRIILFNTVGEDDNWWLDINPTTSFISKEEFTTTFATTPGLNTYAAATSTTNYSICRCNSALGIPFINSSIGQK